jgi:hypothetical protein
MSKVKVRFIKDVTYAGKTFLKNSMIECNEMDGDVYIFSESGSTRVLKSMEVSVITGRELFTMNDMYAMADWSTNPYLDENKELRSKIAGLEHAINTLKNMNAVLEERLYAVRKVD